MCDQGHGNCISYMRSSTIERAFPISDTETNAKCVLLAKPCEDYVALCPSIRRTWWIGHDGP